MTPTQRAALRELAAEPGNIWAFIIVVQKALPKLLDDCDRLERERDEARRFVRWRASTDYTPKLIREEMARWDAEDVQAKKEGGE